MTGKKKHKKSKKAKKSKKQSKNLDDFFNLLPDDSFEISPAKLPRQPRASEKRAGHSYDDDEIDYCRDCGSLINSTGHCPSCDY